MFLILLVDDFYCLKWFILCDMDMFSLYSSILQAFVECVSSNLLSTVFMNVLRNILYIYFTISQEFLQCFI